MDEIRCWRCDRKLGESDRGPLRPPAPKPVVEPGVHQDRIIISCPRCRAPNVVLVLDKAAITA